MTNRWWLSLVLGTTIILVSVGAAVVLGLTLRGQSDADSVTLQSQALVTSGDLKLWSDRNRTSEVTSLRFELPPVTQPPLRLLTVPLVIQELFIENISTVDLWLRRPCGDVESSPGVKIGTMDVRVYELDFFGQFERFLGNSCDFPRRAKLRAGDMVRAEVRFDAITDLAPGTYNFQTVFDAVRSTADLPAVPPAGMVSWWPGDGNAMDIVDHNDGTLSGDAGFAPGMVGQGFSFDGTGDLVIVPASPNLNILGDVTVDLWAKRARFRFGAFSHLLNKGGGVTGNVDVPTAYALSFNQSDELRASFERADGTGVELTGPAVVDDAFHHYAYVRSGNNHKLFMDGVVVASGDFAGTPGDTSALPFVIGAFRTDSDPTGFASYFGGVIDEVEVFNRALTDTEIEGIFNAGVMGKIKPFAIAPPPGMISWWPGDDNAIDIADHNDGTLQNGAGFANGHVGRAFNLDGVDDYVRVPDSANLRISGDLTIDAWIKYQAGASGQNIVTKYESDSAGGGVAYSLTLETANTTSARVAFSVYQTKDVSIHRALDTNTGVVPAGIWTHVAGTFDLATQDIKIYVNGAEVPATLRSGSTVITSIFPSTSPIRIGAFRNISGVDTGYFDGAIDEVELFNRALAATEIKAIYDAGRLGKIKPTRPVAGDVNGDGVPDFIVGAWQDDPAGSGSTAGSAYVFSGADGSVLYHRTGDTSGDRFGLSVSMAGDVNEHRDGKADFIVGAIDDDPAGGGTNAGSAYVFSGADGSLLFQVTGDTAGDAFGRSVSGAGDVNGDGRTDFIVGAYRDDPAGSVTNAGSAYVFSGADGSLFFQVTGDPASDLFGRSVSGVGDVNGDGKADFIVGAYHDDPAGGGINAGSAYVFSGADGSVLYHKTGDTGNDQFGIFVSGVGDVNGDGRADFIVGAPFDDPVGGGADAGSAYVFSGADGSLLFQRTGDTAGDWFGWSVSGAGDVNGDGRADFIVGAYHDDPAGGGTDAGSAYVFSGADGSLLFQVTGDTAGDSFGFAVSGAGDVNGDGKADFIVGADKDDPVGGGTDAGSAYVFSGADGTLLYHMTGDTASDSFGVSVSGAK